MKKIFIILGIVVILASLAVAGYWYWQLKQSTSMTDVGNVEDPAWVIEIMSGTKIYGKWDQREETVSRCIYQGGLVYYITYSGDDLYNDLFKKNGNKICSPTGGLASDNGDGQCSDFFEDEKNCQLIWKKVQ